MKDLVLKQHGFTLMELIAVMVIIGLIGAMAVSRFVDLDSSATAKAVDAAISELNGRESLIWADIKFLVSGYDALTGDADVWAQMKNDATKSFPDLGEAFKWTSGPDETGGALSFRGNSGVLLRRRTSEKSKPARWTRWTGP